MNAKYSALVSRFQCTQALRRRTQTLHFTAARLIKRMIDCGQPEERREREEWLNKSNAKIYECKGRYLCVSRADKGSPRPVGRPRSFVPLFSYFSSSSSSFLLLFRCSFRPKMETASFDWMERERKVFLLVSAARKNWKLYEASGSVASIFGELRVLSLHRKMCGWHVIRHSVNNSVHRLRMQISWARDVRQTAHAFFLIKMLMRSFSTWFFFFSIFCAHEMMQIRRAEREERERERENAAWAGKTITIER